MEKIEIDLEVWESATCPICTANVDLDKAERRLYLSALNNYTESQLEDFFTNENYHGVGWTREWEKFHEWLWSEEEAVVLECGGVYYEDK
jgi:hypothetical protein